MASYATRALGRARDGRPARIFPLVLLLVPAVGCDDAVDLPAATPLEIVIESGDGQVAPAGDTLPQSVVAKVLGPDGAVNLRGIWVELVDGGSVDLGGLRGSGQGVVLRSPTSGTVAVEWVLSEEVGTQTLRFFALELYGDTVEARASAEATTPDPGH